MVQQPNEDLFEPSKMTFGEHLEELRVCLVRALIGLAIGFLIGLLFAGAVVRKIEVPLKSALDKFYFDKAVSELKSEYGKDVPADLQNFMQADQMVYVENHDVEARLQMEPYRPPCKFLQPANKDCH